MNNNPTTIHQALALCTNNMHGSPAHDRGKTFLLKAFMEIKGYTLGVPPMAGRWALIHGLVWDWVATLPNLPAPRTWHSGRILR